MIIDSLLGLERYFSSYPDFEKVFHFLRRQPLENLPEGRHEIDGDRIYATVTEKTGKKIEEATLEVHDSYIDIQILIKGTELIGWRDRRECAKIHTPYDAIKDIAYYEELPVLFFIPAPGSIAIFFPYDAHAPMIGKEVIRKIVVKVKI